jgi:hypothetical protein
MLVDASFASAREAARLAVQLSGVSKGELAGVG